MQLPDVARLGRLQDGKLQGLLSLPLRMLEWVVGAQRIGAEAILRQMELANRLSYLAIDDIMFPGIVRLQPSCS